MSFAKHGAVQGQGNDTEQKDTAGHSSSVRVRQGRCIDGCHARKAYPARAQGRDQSYVWMKHWFALPENPRRSPSQTLHPQETPARCSTTRPSQMHTLYSRCISYGSTSFLSTQCSWC